MNEMSTPARSSNPTNDPNSQIRVNDEHKTPETRDTPTQEMPVQDPPACEPTSPVSLNGTGGKDHLDDSQRPSDPQKPKVWTVADAPKTSPTGATSIRVGQLVWACIIMLTSVFLIALPFLEPENLPLFFIALVALLGVSLIVAAFAVGREAKRKGD